MFKARGQCAPCESELSPVLIFSRKPGPRLYGGLKRFSRIEIAFQPLFKTQTGETSEEEGIIQVDIWWIIPDLR